LPDLCAVGRRRLGGFALLSSVRQLLALQFPANAAHGTLRLA